MPTTTDREASDLFRRPPEGFLDVGAGEVAYRRIGTGPDVLLVHGWPVSGATFRALLPHLVEHVTCHLIDLPGAGDSRFTAATPLTLADHIRSVATVLDLLSLDDVAVVGGAAIRGDAKFEIAEGESFNRESAHSLADAETVCRQRCQRCVRIGNGDGDGATAEQPEPKRGTAPYGAHGPRRRPPESVAHGVPGNLDDPRVLDVVELVPRSRPADEPPVDGHALRAARGPGRPRR